MDEEEIRVEPEGPEPPADARWAGTMRSAAVSGSGQGGPGRGAGRGARSALGRPAAGWFAATFLAGAVVALLIALLAEPSTTVVSPVASNGPVRNGPFGAVPAVPPGAQRDWVQVRGPGGGSGTMTIPAPWARRVTLTLPGGAALPPGAVLPGGVMPPGGAMPPGAQAGRLCRAVAIPRVIKGRAGKVQVVLPGSAAGPFASRLVRLPGGLPPFAIGQVVLPSGMIVAAPAGGPAGINVPAIRPATLHGQRMSWVKAPSFTIIRGRAGQITVQLGKPAVPGQVRSWMAVPGGVPAAFGQAVCAGPAAQVYLP